MNGSVDSPGRWAQGDQWDWVCAFERADSMVVRQQRQTTQSVERSLDILEAVADSDGPIGVSALARDIGLSKATVYRLCQTLVERSFLEQDPRTGEYRLGGRLVAVASRAIGRLGFADLSRPVLEDMARRGRQNAFAATVSGEHALFVCEEVRVQGPVQPQSLLGLRRHLLDAPGGLLCLAAWPEDRFRPFVRDLVRSSPADWTPQKVLDQVLPLRGRACCVQSVLDNRNLRTLCSVVRDYRGQVAGVLGYCYPSLPIDPVNEDELSTFCDEAAKTLSQTAVPPAALGG